MFEFVKYEYESSEFVLRGCISVRLSVYAIMLGPNGQSSEN